MKTPDLKGEVFGKLTVVRLSDQRQGAKRLWHCRCKCGGLTLSTTGNLNSGSSQSCGCEFKPKKKERSPPKKCLIKGARYIPLTQGKYALVDKEDFKTLSKWDDWYAAKLGHTFYAVRSEKKRGKWRVVHMHRAILKTPLDVDHKDGNGLNNRRKNLRPCTDTQNQQNRHRTTGTSRFKGVSWNKRDKKWQSSISINGKATALGYFDKEIDAAKAYDKAAKLHFGSFAKLNYKRPT